MIPYVHSRKLFIATFLLQALSPRTLPMPNNSMMSPFAFPLSPNVPPFNPSPTQTPHYSNSPRHDTPKKKSTTSKVVLGHGFQDKRSGSTNGSCSKESTSTTKAQSLFVPLQVCTLIALRVLGTKMISEARVTRQINCDDVDILEELLARIHSRNVFCILQ